MVPIDWANVVGIEFALVKTGEHLVPRDAWFDLTLDTELREKKRGTETLVDVALKEIGYTIPNTAEATIVRGGDSATDNPSKDLKVVTENSVAIAPVLTKSFSPAGPATFFPQNGVPTPIEVALSLNAGGEDAADKIVFVDKDPTFWNAFDFAGWNPAPTSNGTVTIEYLAGATFTTGAAKELIDDGMGTWRTTRPANGDVQGIRITMQGADYEPLDKTVNQVKFKVMPRYTLRTGELNSIDGVSRNPGESKKSAVENTATAAMERLGQKRTVPDVSTEYQFTPGATQAGVSKTSDALGGQISAGGAVNYTIKVTNSGTEAILDPVIVDKLPPDKEDCCWNSIRIGPRKLKYSFGKLFNAAPARHVDDDRFHAHRCSSCQRQRGNVHFPRRERSCTRASPTPSFFR